MNGNSIHELSSFLKQVKKNLPVQLASKNFLNSVVIVPDSRAIFVFPDTDFYIFFRKLLFGLNSEQSNFFFPSLFWPLLLCTVELKFGKLILIAYSCTTK